MNVYYNDVHTMFMMFIPDYERHEHSMNIERPNVHSISCCFLNRIHAGMNVMNIVCTSFVAEGINYDAT